MNLTNKTHTSVQDPPQPINVPTKIKSDDNIMINNCYINMQIDLIEKTLKKTFEEINMASVNCANCGDRDGYKNEWDTNFFPKLAKIKNDITNLIKCIKEKQPILFDKIVESKLDELMFQCFSIMMIGDKYFLV